ncbi:MAG: protein phosphatase 2C domain-containing protein [Sporichthyaceae bacterium]|nr:protein phosphatase 2C domain-containing protein [Sporichthyaceae bacterium]
MSLVLRAAAVTDIGLSRMNNEDSAYAGPRLAVVADGIGGMPAGELASALVVRELAPLDPAGAMAIPINGAAAEPATKPLSPVSDPTDEQPTVRIPGDGVDPIAALRDSVAAANRKIRNVSHVDLDTDGMGTTVTALLLAGDRIGLLHVGDSRGYRLRTGVLGQITRDDTYVQTLVDQGLISVAEARNHPRRSVVMQAVQGLEYEPTCSVLAAVVGDRYLLCSDGLSDVVDDETIADALTAEPDVARCANLLVRLALEAGAPDNVTVIVADVAEDAH